MHLDQLPNSTSVLFEEPIIDQTTTGTWKLLLEGSPIPTDMKHTDKELIHRLHIFISTNHRLWNWIGSKDRLPIERVFQFEFTNTIQSIPTYSFKIPAPPSILTTTDIYFLLLLYFPQLLQHIQTISNSYLNCPDKLTFTTDIFTTLSHHSSLIQIQEAPTFDALLQ